MDKDSGCARVVVPAPVDRPPRSQRSQVATRAGCRSSACSGRVQGARQVAASIPITDQRREVRVNHVDFKVGQRVGGENSSMLRMNLSPTDS